MEEVKTLYSIIDEYEQYTGTQTSMATLYIPPDKHLDVVNAMLVDDLKSKDNIKKPVNRNNTIEAVAGMIWTVNNLWTISVNLCDQGHENGIIILSGITTTGDHIETIITDLPQPTSFKYYNASKF